jgi:hypothetical protein
MSASCLSPRRLRLFASALLPWIALTAMGQSFSIVNSTGTASANALALANNIKGTGIQSFSNLSLTAHIGAGAAKSTDSSSAGTFTGGQGIIGISSGIVLSSGGVQNVVGPNTTDDITSSLGLAGDGDLAGLIGLSAGGLHDATILEFDFVPTFPTIAFRYVFGSEEYPEYANTQYNDVFGFFVNGHATANNCALIPGTSTPVSINNVNGGNPIGTNPHFAQYYRDNTGNAYNTELDGITTVFSAQASVTPGVVNHIKIAIADTSDDLYDSAVFIQQSSFVSGNAPVAVNDSYSLSKNGSLTVAAGTGVLQNDTDLDNNIQGAQLIASPAHGTVTLNTDGSFTYTPTTGYSGTDSFTYQAVDTTFIQSNVGFVTLTISSTPAVAVSSLNRAGSTPSKAATVNWTLTFGSAVTGVTASNFSLSGAAATGASVGTPTTSDSGLTWTVPVTTGSTDGTLTLSLANATGLSPSVSTSLPFAGQSYTMDKTAPGVSIGSPSVSVTAGGPVSFTVTYSDANFSGATLGSGDVTVNSTGSASAGSVGVTGSGTTRTVTLTGITGDGTLGISLASGTASDTVGNLAGAAGPSTTFTVDNTAPGIAIGAPSASTATTGPVTYTVTYSGENSITLGGGDLTLNKTGTADAGSVMVSGTGSTRTVTLSSLTGVGTLGISVAAGTASDTAGNLAGAAGPGTTFTVDNSPVVTTLTATNLTLTGAVLTGTVNPNGLSTVAVFESGADTNYGTVSALTLTPDNGTVDQAVNATLTGLTPGTTYHYRVAATNSAGAALGVDLTFTTAPDTSAPTNIVLSPSIVLENQSVGTTVGTLTAPDPDAALGDTATFSLVAGVGDTDNSSFSIVGNQLQTGAVFDYETKNSYSIRVRVTDVGGLTFEKALTVGIGNVNEPPIYTGYGFTCPVNTSVSVLVSKITAKTSDPEGVTRTVPSVDAVSLQGGTVVLLSGPPKTISYTPPTGYTGDDSFEVRISDGVNTITGIVTVTVGSSSGNGTALVSATMVGSDMVLKFAGIPGTHYEVQRSGGLTPPVTWTVLTTVTADASGFATYTDPNPPSPSYWRTVTVP